MRPHTLSPALLTSFGLALLTLAAPTSQITPSHSLTTATPTSAILDTLSGLTTPIGLHAASTDSDGQPTRPPEPPDLDKRWVNICNECVGSTGTTSFKGARKSLTKDNDKYKKAKKTVVPTKRKIVKTSDGCSSTVIRKAKKTMYVVWVRPDSFANNEPYQDVSTASGARASLLLAGLMSVVAGTVLIL